MNSQRSNLRATEEILESGHQFLQMSRELLRSHPIPQMPIAVQEIFVDPFIQLEEQISGSTGNPAIESPRATSRESRSRHSSSFSHSNSPPKINPLSLTSAAASLVSQNLSSIGSNRFDPPSPLVKGGPELEVDRSVYQNTSSMRSSHFNRFVTSTDLDPPNPLEKGGPELKLELDAKSESKLQPTIEPELQTQFKTRFKTQLQPKANIQVPTRLKTESNPNTQLSPETQLRDLRFNNIPSTGGISPQPSPYEGEGERNAGTLFIGKSLNPNTPLNPEAQPIIKVPLTKGNLGGSGSIAMTSQSRLAHLLQANIPNAQEPPIDRPPIPQSSSQSSSQSEIIHPAIDRQDSSHSPVHTQSTPLIHPAETSNFSKTPALPIVPSEWGIDDLLDCLTDRLELDYLRTYGTSGR